MSAQLRLAIYHHEKRFWNLWKNLLAFIFPIFIYVLQVAGTRHSSSTRTVNRTPVTLHDESGQKQDIAKYIRSLSIRTEG